MADTDYMQQLRQMFEGIRDERRVYSNTATRIGNAFLALLSYLAADAAYLRKDREDSTNYLLRLLAGAVIGEGKIHLNPDGSITCGRLHVEGSAIFDELVFNRQEVTAGDQIFTDRGIIETVEHIDINAYRLWMRKEHDNDVVTFHEHDVLRAVYNNLLKDGSYSTSWFRAYHATEDYVDVILYDGEDVPGGVNYPPLPAGRVARWGNAIDEDRQQCFFLSSLDGRFMFLQGVTKPILDDNNVAAFIGVPPEMECLKDLPINKRQPYIYARGLIVQDIIRVDYHGNPIYEVRDMGVWDSAVQYIHGYDPVEQMHVTHMVWYGGCGWQCAVDKATVGTPPRWNNADWICVVGVGDYTCWLESSEGDFFPAGAHWTTQLQGHLLHGEQELTEAEIGVMNITWTRISDDTTGDAVWNLAHKPGTCGLTVNIDSMVDVPAAFRGGFKLAFKIEIFLPDGKTFGSTYEIT